MSLCRPFTKSFPKKEAEKGNISYALAKYRKTHKNDFTLQRYKGLGEMDPEQLWETTLDPRRRYMKQVQIEDAINASDITELLMGSEVPPRRMFIHDHADDAELDV